MKGRASCRPYEPHASRLPLELQDQANPVRFRNVWVRQLDEGEDAGPPPDRRPVVALDVEQAAAYAGLYVDAEHTVGRVFFEDGHLWIDLFDSGRILRLVAHSPTGFSFSRTAGEIRFELDERSRPTALILSLAGIDARGERPEP